MKVFKIILLSFKDPSGKGPGRKKWNCPFDKCFYAGYKDDLVAHVRAKHTEEKLYHCPYENCGMRFASNSAINAHKKNHQDKTKKLCVACKKFYSVKSGCRSKSCKTLSI